MKYKVLTEKELHSYADKLSDTIAIRDTSDTNSNTVVWRETSPQEKEKLENIFFSALWTLNWHNASMSYEKMQAVQDMAECMTNCVFKDEPVNAYESVYIPLSKLAGELSKETEKERE